MSDLTGTTLGRYRLERKLAEGGMAEVYLAVLAGAAGFEKPAVVKRMLPSLASEAEHRELFVAEARLMASLSHANLVTVLDFGEADGSYYLALEYVEGVDLARAVKARGKLEPAIAVGIAAAVLRGLAYLHARRDARGEPLNIVHRDVSPHNVLLGTSGDVKLGDFGIAKSAVRRPRTAPGSTRGKLRYMSPEQAAGRAVDGRSDLFAVGLLLHEALTGRSPFATSTDAQLLLAVQAGNVGPLDELTRAVGAPLVEVLRRALQRAPEQRFASAVEMEKALCAAVTPASPLEVGALATALVDELSHDAARPAASERGAFSSALLGLVIDDTPTKDLRR